MSVWDIIARSRDELLKYAVEKLQFHLSTEPVPARWHAILARSVPLANTLNAAERDRLLRVARLLISEVPFEGVSAVVLTDEMRVTIAATASLLIYRLPYPRFTRLVRILVYPEKFIPKQPASSRDTTVIESDPSLGEALRSGVVVLSWEAVQNDAANQHASGSVVLHEMAHILDAEDGIFDGMPVFDDAAQGAKWARILDREFTRQRDAVEAGEEGPLDDYAARNHAEFFAVATEAFFCSPESLRTKLPDLYEQLERFYRRDIA